MRKVVGFLALGLLGGLLGTHLPGAAPGYQLKVIGLPAAARTALAASGSHFTQQGSVLIIEGRSKKAAFNALAEAHSVVQSEYDRAWRNLEAIEDGDLGLNEAQEEQQLDSAELGLSVIEQAMQELEPSLITP